MIRMMGQEHNEKFAKGPAWINTVVKMARDYLKTHKDVVCTLFDKRAKPQDVQRTMNKLENGEIGAVLISKYLGEGWPKTKVDMALKQIKLTETDDEESGNPILDNGALGMLENQKSANAFADITEKTANDPKNPTPIPAEEQRAIANAVREEGLKSGEIEKAFKEKSATYREHKRAKKPPKREKHDNEVHREKLVEVLKLLKFSLGKEKTTHTNYFVFHGSKVMTCDDKISVIASTELNISCAVEHDLLDTLESCNDLFVKITYQGDHVTVEMDSGCSTIKAKPIQQLASLTEYIIGIDKLKKGIKLPWDFVQGVATCFSFKRQSREIVCYEEEKMIFVGGSQVYATDMWRVCSYEMGGEVETNIFLPYWLAATFEDMHKKNYQANGYVTHEKHMYFGLSNGTTIVAEEPVVKDGRFPKKQLQEIFAKFHKDKHIELPKLKPILKDCESKQEKIKVRTDARITLSFGNEKLKVETVLHEKNTGSVSREEKCMTEGHYSFTVARVHLEEALKSSDTMYVSDGALMFERGSYKHMLPVSDNGKLDYLIKHEC